MADLRIADAPTMQASEIQDGLRIPTGGYGNYAVTLLTIRDWLVNFKAIATQTELVEKYDYLQTQISAYANSGNKSYTTLALAQADTANIPVNSAVFVTNDPNSDNNGLYQWNGTVLTKSNYDPITQAKADATQKANTALSTSKAYTDSFVGKSLSKIIPLAKDSNGKTPLWIDEGRLGFPELELGTKDRVKTQFGLGNSASKHIIPVVADINNKSPLWLEDGEINFSGIANSAVEIIKDKLGPISGGASNNVTNAAYPIVSDSASLRQFKAKASKLKVGTTQQLRVLLTGDSWTEHRTITNEVLNLVRAEYGESGSGWINLGVENNQLDGISLTRAGSWSYADLNGVSSFPNGSGPDGFTLTSTTAGNTITVSNLEKGNQLTVFFGKTDGSFKYSINGGIETTVTASSTGATLQSVVIPISGMSNILFTTVSGTVVFFGMHLRQTTGSGVEVTKMGNGGSTGQDFLKISPTAQNNFAAYLKPDIVIIILGTNDYRYGHSVANFKAGISAIIDGYRNGNPNCGVILIAPAQSNAPAVIPLSEYRDAIYELAQTKKAEFYNMYDDWDAYSSENSNGQWADAYHVSQAGAYRIAQKLFKNFLEI